MLAEFFVVANGYQKFGSIYDGCIFFGRFLVAAKISVDPDIQWRLGSLGVNNVTTRFRQPSHIFVIRCRNVMPRK